ncbi:hypothetical protein ACP70R_039618 [Stipagrostis hirtigluma subsp. patula]
MRTSIDASPAIIPDTSTTNSIVADALGFRDHGGGVPRSRRPVAGPPQPGGRRPRPAAAAALAAEQGAAGRRRGGRRQRSASSERVFGARVHTVARSSPEPAAWVWGDGDGDDGAAFVPPHVVAARRRCSESEERAASSVCVGHGRTLKGRDLRCVRTAVLRMTGFLES